MLMLTHRNSRVFAFDVKQRCYNENNNGKLIYVSNFLNDLSKRIGFCGQYL